MSRRTRLRIIVVLVALVGAALVGALVWAWRTSKPVWHTGKIQALAFTHDGEWLLSGDSERELKLWRTSDLLRGWGRGFVTLRVPPPPVAQSAADNTPSGTIVDVDGITCVAIAPDDRRALVGFRDGRLELWDLALRSLERTLRPDGWSVTSVAISPDGRTALSGEEKPESGSLVLGFRGAIRVWDLATGGSPSTWRRGASTASRSRRTDDSPW
ncbi:MAG: WD40 repeat domain-containing protein [Planctomycetota bacterium]